MHIAITQRQGYLPRSTHTKQNTTHLQPSCPFLSPVLFAPPLPVSQSGLALQPALSQAGPAVLCILPRAQPSSAQLPVISTRCHCTAQHISTHDHTGQRATHAITRSHLNLSLAESQSAIPHDAIRISMLQIETYISLAVSVLLSRTQRFILPLSLSFARARAFVSFTRALVFAVLYYAHTKAEQRACGRERTASRAARFLSSSAKNVMSKSRSFSTSLDSSSSSSAIYKLHTICVNLAASVFRTPVHSITTCACAFSLSLSLHHTGAQSFICDLHRLTQNQNRTSPQNRCAGRQKKNTNRQTYKIPAWVTTGPQPS